METTHYPAGHSMDSQWFAVDKDGHIGFFDTSDEGPLPIMFEKQQYWSQFLFEHSTPIQGNLHKLILPEDTVNEIISQCSYDILVEMISDYERDGFIFFSGFILLNDTKNWNDLGFQQAIDNSSEDYALKISDDKALYYIGYIEGYTILFIEAIKNGSIKAAVFADLIDTDNDWEKNKFSIDIFGGFRFGDDDGFGNDPYRCEFIPKNPLHISAFAEGTKDKIPVLENISFRNDVKEYFQPLEHLSCRTFIRGDRTPREFLKKGYLKVKASDNKTEIYCRMASGEYLTELMELFDCAQCNNGERRFAHSTASAKTDFPPILLLTKAEEKEYWILKSFIKENVLPFLNIDDKAIYSTCCVKCVDNNDEITSYPQLKERFFNCHPKLEMECEYLKPLLLIGIGNEVFNLLQSVYAFSNSPYNNGSFYELIINKTNFPFLAIDENINGFTENQKALLQLKIKDILATYREIRIEPRIYQHK